MPVVFMSYRRSDCPGHAGRVYDRPVDRVGRERVFMDIAAIAPGVDYAERIQEADIQAHPATSIRVGKQPATLAIGGRCLWVADARDGALWRIDLRARKVAGTPFFRGHPIPLDRDLRGNGVTYANPTATRARPDRRHAIAAATVTCRPIGAQADTRQAVRAGFELWAVTNHSGLSHRRRRLATAEPAARCGR